MLISPKATDTIYQAVLHFLKEQGVTITKPLQQHVLLRDNMFLGYRFQGANLQIDWLAQHNVLVVTDYDGRILTQKQLSSQISEENGLPSDGTQNPLAA